MYLTKFWGTEGYIDIFNPNLEKVGTINKQSLKRWFIYI